MGWAQVVDDLLRQVLGLHGFLSLSDRVVSLIDESSGDCLMNVEQANHVLHVDDGQVVRVLVLQRLQVLVIAQLEQMQFGYVRELSGSELHLLS